MVNKKEVSNLGMIIWMFVIITIITMLITFWHISEEKVMYNQFEVVGIETDKDNKTIYTLSFKSNGTRGATRTLKMTHDTDAFKIGDKLSLYHTIISLNTEELLNRSQK